MNNRWDSVPCKDLRDSEVNCKFAIAAAEQSTSYTLITVQASRTMLFFEYMFVFSEIWYISYTAEERLLVVSGIFLAE